MRSLRAWETLLPGRERAQEGWETEQENFNAAGEVKVEKGPRQKIEERKAAMD